MSRQNIATLWRHRRVLHYPTWRLICSFPGIFGQFCPQWENNKIYHHFVQGQGNPPECQRFAVHDEACRVVEVAYLWHEGGFPCSCTKWWLIIFLLSLLIAVRNPLFYFRHYYRTFSYHKTAPTRRRVIVKVMTSLYDLHFRFVHNGVVGDNPLETRFWILIKHMDKRVWGRRKIDHNLVLVFVVQ